MAISVKPPAFLVLLLGLVEPLRILRGLCLVFQHEHWVRCNCPMVNEAGAIDQ